MLTINRPRLRERTRPRARPRHFVVAVTACFAASAWAQRVIHVKGDADGVADGSSWDHAYTDLQDALDDARLYGGCPCEVWIAQGTYKPERGTLDRTLAFELVDQVALYGGFGGWETCLDERDPALHVTTLSGDLLGDDAGHPPPTSSCCTVTFLPGCDNAMCAEVTNANDLSPITCATHWDSNCLFLAQEFCCDLCRPGRCDNAYNVIRAVEPNSVVVLDGLTVTGGEGIGSEGPYSQGGGLYTDGVEVTIRGCTFISNFAYQGAAIYLWTGTATVSNTTVVENVVRGDLSSAIYTRRADLTLTDCEFVRNRGGSIYSYENTLRIERCLFLENIAPGSEGAGLNLGLLSDTLITDCAFIHNRGAGGPAMQLDGVARVRNSVFIGNQARSSAGAILSCGALSLTNSLFVGNRVSGIAFYPFQGTGGGGGIGGALDNSCGSAAILNCTFVNNHAGSAGGVDAGFGLSMRNCILWGNTDDGSTIENAQVHAYDPGSLRIDHSIVAGWTGAYGGVGNSGLNPQFVDADGADNIIGTEDDDLRVRPGSPSQSGSPAIDAGNPDATGLPLTDLDGHARVLCEGVDIGAYEFGIGDYNCDRSVDLTDFANWQTCMTGPNTADTAVPHCQAFDFNADGDVDLRDLYSLLQVFAGS